MSGNQWSPNNDLNPAKNWDYVTGLVGLRLRDAVPLRPAQGQVHPVARDERQVDVEDDLRDDDPQGREVERRQGDDRRRRQVQLRPREDRDASAASALAGHRAEEHEGRGNNVVFTFAGSAGLPAVRLLPLQRRGRAAAHLQELQPTDIATGNLGTRRRSSAPARTCYQSGVGAPSQTVVWKKSDGLVGDEGARPERRRRRTSSTSRTARTPRRCRTCSPGTSTSSTTSRRSRRSRASSRPTSARRPYHLGANTTWLFPNTTQQAARRQAVPPGARVLDQHEPDPRQGLPGPRQQGEPDGPAADLEQVGRQEGRQAVRLLVQRRQGEGDPRRRRLQGHERRRLRREQGRLEDRPPDHLPERVVGLDDVDPGDRRQREGRRHQDHARASPSTGRSSTTAATRKYDLLLGNDRQY